MDAAINETLPIATIEEETDDAKEEGEKYDDAEDQLIKFTGDVSKRKGDLKRDQIGTFVEACGQACATVPRGSVSLDSVADEFRESKPKSYQIQNLNLPSEQF